MKNIINSKYNGIIIFGDMGSGKDTLANYLIKENSLCYKYNLGDIVRQFYKIVKINPKYNNDTRIFGQNISDNLRNISESILNDYTLASIYEKYEDIMPKFNDNTSSNTLLDVASAISSNEIPIIVGGRNMNDFEYWTSLNFLPIGITADYSSRITRINFRDGSALAPQIASSHNTESQVKNIIENKISTIINNNGDLDLLAKKATELLSIYLSS